MFNKIIYTMTIGSSLLAFLPNEAEAVKLKIEPSITFRNSYESTRVYPSRVPVRPVHVHSRPIYRTYEQVPVRPVPIRTYYYEAVPQREVIYYPEYEDAYYYYNAPSHYRTRTSGTDFGLTFKLK